MTVYEIRELRDKLRKRSQDLDWEHKVLALDYERLYLECSHPNKYETNTWGRDPGGAFCPDCGKNW